MTGRGLKAGTLLLVTLCAAVIGYLVSRWLHTQGGGLPTPSWVSLLLLLAMAGGIVGAGVPIRRVLRGMSHRRLDPIRAFRTLVLAQAGALTGALVAGWYGGEGLALLPDADAASVRQVVWVAFSLAAGGVLLAVAGMWTQAMCRIDPPDEPPEDPEDLNGDEDHLLPR